MPQHLFGPAPRRPGQHVGRARGAVLPDLPATPALALSGPVAQRAAMAVAERARVGGCTSGAAAASTTPGRMFLEPLATAWAEALTAGASWPDLPM